MATFVLLISLWFDIVPSPSKYPLISADIKLFDIFAIVLPYVFLGNNPKFFISLKILLLEISNDTYVFLAFVYSNIGLLVPKTCFRIFNIFFLNTDSEYILLFFIFGFIHTPICTNKT